MDMGSHHHGKDDAYLLHSLEDAKDEKHAHLDQGVGVESPVGNMADIRLVRFVIVRHENYEDPLHKLYEEGEGEREK